MKSFIIYALGIFLIIYGAISIVAGFKGTDREYWYGSRYSPSNSNNRNYKIAINLIYGVIGFVSGILILLFY